VSPGFAGMWARQQTFAIWLESLEIMAGAKRQGARPAWLWGRSPAAPGRRQQGGRPRHGPGL
jgi:hypothetical protein